MKRSREEIVADRKKKHMNKDGSIRISNNTRQSRAGDLRAQSIIEDAHNLYLDMNALEYLKAIKKRIDAELARRKAEYFK